MPPLKLTLACWDYDRAKVSKEEGEEKILFMKPAAYILPTQALQDGRVQIEGVDLNFVNLRWVASVSLEC